MSFEITGVLHAILPTVQRSESFKTRDFVVLQSDNINGRKTTVYVKFSATQDRTGIVDRFKEGQKVKVYWNLRGSRWEKNGNVNYITTLDAWRIEAV